MILTGRKLEEIGMSLYGDNWPSVMAARLKKARKTLFRYRDKAPPAEMKQQLAALVEDQLATLAAHLEELREDATEF